MFRSRMPRIVLMRHSLQDPDCHHAIVISLLRGLAAVEVAAAHLRAQMFPSLKTLDDPTLWYQALAFVTGFAHQAVVIFFLLSGWLVGGSLLNKLHTPRVFALYAIDRITRMWIVLIPAFVLTLAIGTVTNAVDPTFVSLARDNAYSFTAFAGNLFGLQDLAVPRYGGNFPLWSLANEIWYYALFPLLVLPFSATTWWGRAAALIAFMLGAWYVSGPILLYLPVWLMGVAFSRIRIDAARWQRAILLMLVALLSVYFRLTGSNDTLVAESFVQDVVFGAAFLMLLSSLQFKADRAHWLVRIAGAAGERLSSFSFTLYVVHVPLLLLLRYVYAPVAGDDLSPFHLSALAVYAMVLVLIIMLAYVFHLPFEAQTLRARSALKQLVFGRRSGALTA